MLKECRRYLKSYENHPAITCSGIVVTNTKTGEQISGFDIAKQYFKKIPEDIIDKLVEKGDIMHCAGGFMIDDRKYLKRLRFLQVDLINIHSLDWTISG